MNKSTKRPLNHLTDEELMTLYRLGEYHAFVELYGRHSGKVLAYLKKRVAVDIAQDLLQEIFLKLHRGRSQYSEQYPFLPWLFTISRNALYDYFKSTKTSNVLPAVDETPADNENVDLNLATALQTLPENQRRAIELRYLEDWSFEKIAKAIKTSPDNVRQLISRGLKKVRKGFGESV
jgi:RNA polymerase sigma factor (sigma-70 family)